VAAGLGDVPEDAVAEVTQHQLGDRLGDLADDAPEMARPFAGREAGKADGTRPAEERVEVVALVLEAAFNRLGVDWERRRRS
jgi:hypothetical protein